MYDFLRRPWWILSHVLVIVAVLVMIRLGFWQMSRWQGENERKGQIEQGLAEEPVPLEDLLTEVSGDPTEVPEDLRFKRVSVSGTWSAEDEVVIRNRSLNGAPGGWVMTPLVLEDGTAVGVVRGWVPLGLANDGGPVEVAEPPSGEVQVSGVIGLTQEEPGFGAKDPADGILDSLARVNLSRYDEQLEQDLLGVWLTMDGMSPPPTNEVVQTVNVEIPTPSQNFSYMVQWFLFATIFGVGYLLILRKVASSRE